MALLSARINTYQYVHIPYLMLFCKDIVTFQVALCHHKGGKSLWKFIIYLDPSTWKSSENLHWIRKNKPGNFLLSTKGHSIHNDTFNIICQLALAVLWQFVHFSYWLVKHSAAAYPRLCTVLWCQVQIIFTLSPSLDWACLNFFVIIYGGGFLCQLSLITHPNHYVSLPLLIGYQYAIFHAQTPEHIVNLGEKLERRTWSWAKIKSRCCLIGRKTATKL